MPKLWVTYAWADNENEDVDFYLQRLRDQGLDVHFDRRALAAGRIIWQQLGDAIADPTKCDAWLGITSSASLASARWQEEMYYALDRALNTRQLFPLMFLVLGETPSNLPPAARNPPLRVKVLLNTFGFAYNDDAERAVATFTCYLAKLSPEHQRLWQARELGPEFKVHPEFFRTQVIGQFPKTIPVCDAFFREMEVIAGGKHKLKMCRKHQPYPA